MCTQWNFRTPHEDASWLARPAAVLGMWQCTYHTMKHTVKIRKTNWQHAGNTSRAPTVHDCSTNRANMQGTPGASTAAQTLTTLQVHPMQQLQDKFRHTAGISNAQLQHILSIDCRPIQGNHCRINSDRLQAYPRQQLQNKFRHTAGIPNATTAAQIHTVL